MNAQGLSSQLGQLLDFAQPVLQPFFATAFQALQRQLVATDKAPLVEPPRELLPFLNFKPRQAANQEQVRLALIKLVLDSDELWESIAHLHKGPKVSASDVVDALMRQEASRLPTIASSAAAFRPVDWTETVRAAAIAHEAFDLGKDAGSAEAAKHESDAAKKLSRSSDRLENKVAKLENDVVSRDRDLAGARAKRAELASKVKILTEANERYEAQVKALDDDHSVLNESIEQLKAAIAASEKAFIDTSSDFSLHQAQLMAQIETLRGAQDPDLSAHARAIARHATALRGLAHQLLAGGNSTDEDEDVHEVFDFGAEVGRLQPERVELGVEAAQDESIVNEASLAPLEITATTTEKPARRPAAARSHNGRTKSGPRKRASLPFPPGMYPDSVDAIHWALAQPNMLVVVDGYNVTRQQERGWGELAGEAQRGLMLARCVQAHRWGGADIHIVFDSSEKPYSHGTGRRLSQAGVTFEFTEGETADDRIVALIAQLIGDVVAFVVTSDRELQDRIMAKGARCVRSELFLDAIGAPSRR